MKGIRVIKTDGTSLELGGQSLSLKEAQKHVGGLIELVAIPGNYTNKIGDKIIYVNEEGLLQHLPFNFGASVIAGKGLVGDALIVENEACDFGD